MPFRSGHLSYVAYDKLNASEFLNQSEWNYSLTNAETTHYKSAAKEYIPGIAEGSLSLAGMYDAGATPTTGPDSVLDALTDRTTPFPVTMFLDGGAFPGRRCYLANVLQRSYTPSSPIGGVVEMKVETVTNARPKSGSCLTDESTAYTTAATTNGTSVDNAAATNNGATINIHVPANTWTGTTTVKVQHSTDNAVWVDVTGSTQVVPASTAAAYTLDVTGTVNRYTRAVVTTAAGSGSVRVLVAIARN